VERLRNYSTAVWPIVGYIFLVYLPPSAFGSHEVRALIFPLFISMFLVSGLSYVFLFGHIIRSGTRQIRRAFAELASFVATTILFYAIAYRGLGIIEDDKLVEKPLDCLYFSIVTWTTLGYGDIKPSADTRMYAASEALFGYIFMGLYLALIFQVISSGSTPRSYKDDDWSAFPPDP
jgi:hypothetical protein